MSERRPLRAWLLLSLAFLAAAQARSFNVLPNGVEAIASSPAFVPRDGRV